MNRKENSPAVEAALDDIEKLDTVVRMGADGIEEVAVDRLSPEERAVLLALLVERRKRGMI